MNASFTYMQFLTEEEYQRAIDAGDEFVAKMGAEAIQDLLCKIDLKKLEVELTEQMQATRSKQIKKSFPSV